MLKTIIYYHMKLYKYLIILFFLSSCHENSKNKIVFSCILCKGCVQNNLEFIIKNKLYERYEVILDTNCLNNNNIENYKQTKFKHLSFDEIKQKYGEFGNFILIDKDGKKTEFMTDMSISEYIKN